jgi:hypothetical protein
MKLFFVKVLAASRQGIQPLPCKCDKYLHYTNLRLFGNGFRSLLGMCVQNFTYFWDLEAMKVGPAIHSGPIYFAYTGNVV